MGKVKLDGYQCERCEHVWAPRSKIEEEPTICPKCKSPYWNKPRLNSTKRRAIIQHFKKRENKND